MCCADRSRFRRTKKGNCFKQNGYFADYIVLVNHYGLIMANNFSDAKFEAAGTLVCPIDTCNDECASASSLYQSTKSFRAQLHLSTRAVRTSR